MEEMTKKISVEEFQQTGMLLYINQVMQPFGLSIAIEDGVLVPIKSKYRGFSQDSVEQAYNKINNYLYENIFEITDID